MNNYNLVGACALENNDESENKERFSTQFKILEVKSDMCFKIGNSTAECWLEVWFMKPEFQKYLQLGKSIKATMTKKVANNLD